jgi:Raf kinase inhibitor-like YbhB/YbcL family protein
MIKANEVAALLLATTVLCSLVGLVPVKSAGKGGACVNLELSSTAFVQGERIPKDFTADGKNVSPPLKWSAAPEGTKSLALVLDDPDAPMGTWVHWVLYNLPANTQELTQGIPMQNTIANGAKQGTNSFHKIGYGGPAPPPGKPHRYFFKLFALDTTLNLDPGADARKVQSAMQGHILGQGELMGQYSR